MRERVDGVGERAGLAGATEERAGLAVGREDTLVRVPEGARVANDGECGAREVEHRVCTGTGVGDAGVRDVVRAGATWRGLGRGRTGR